MDTFLFNAWALAVGLVASVAWLFTLFGVLAWALPQADGYVFFTACVVSMMPPAVIGATGFHVADKIW
tara:strand:+ start:1109 stop:1312 length:204 start_codon:yes stop_codon:yes gene_type:complete